MKLTPAEIVWRQVHLRLTLLAQGTTASYNSDGAHQKPGSKPPPAIDRDVVVLERRWAGCRTDLARRQVVRDAVKLLKLYMPKADIRTRRGTQEWEEAIARDPRTCRVVAEMYGVSHQTVWRYRRKFGITSEVHAA